MSNTNIGKLLTEYEVEDCDFSNMEQVVVNSLRYAETMPDSHVRCLLYTLAKHYKDNNDNNI